MSYEGLTIAGKVKEICREIRGIAQAGNVEGLNQIRMQLTLLGVESSSPPSEPATQVVVPVVQSPPKRPRGRPRKHPLPEQGV